MNVWLYYKDKTSPSVVNSEGVGSEFMATAKKLSSGNYRVRVYDKLTGKYKSFTAPEKNEAEDMATNFLKFRNTGVRGKFTIEEACQAYINERSNILSPASIDRYQRILDNQLSKDFKGIYIDKLSLAPVYAEVNRLCAEYTPKTVKTTVHFFLPILRKYRRDLDFDGIRLPKVFQKVKDYPSPETIIETFRGDRMELEVLLALCYGLRKEEIRGLRPSDLSGNVLTIRRVKIDVGKEAVIRENAAKTVNSIRSITVSEHICKLIQSRTGEYVTTMSGQAIYKHFSRKMQAAGYSITFHDLRHINASVMLALGVPDKYAMERGGWATDSTLKKIYQSTFSDQRKVFDQRIDDYFSEMYAKNMTQKNEKVP